MASGGLTLHRGRAWWLTSAWDRPAMLCFGCLLGSHLTPTLLVSGPYEVYEMEVAERGLSRVLGVDACFGRDATPCARRQFLERLCPWVGRRPFSQAGRDRGCVRSHRGSLLRSPRGRSASVRAGFLPFPDAQKPVLVVISSLPHWPAEPRVW